MRTFLTLAVGAAVGAFITSVLFLALDEDQAATAQAQTLTIEQVTIEDCVELIPDEVVQTLGWQLGESAVEHVGRCQRFGDEGYITVADRAIVASEAERPSAVEKEYVDLCAGLFDGDYATPERDPAWLTEGTTACVRLLRTDGYGTAELLLLTEDDELVQIQVGALTPTDNDAVQDAFAQLVETADAQW